jgi:radical SAM superfamily enzyme YgiQ (UPF0313 family)
MKIDIIIVYMQRYEKGHEFDFVPPITGIHLAAITPRQYEVRVTHQQVEPVNLDTDADVVALSFFSGFAPEAYRLASLFKQKGKIVVAGGPHVTFSPEEALQYCDAVVVGEAELVWPELLADVERAALRQIYQGQPQPLTDLPTPRYDLLPNNFFVKRVIQATRGCPFTCSFCTVPTLNPGFRLRPVEEVIKDIQYNDFKYWWQRKVVWFWDDNLTANRKYVKELLRAMIPLKKWWLTQASMDIAKDEELLDLMQASGCIGVFFGIETFGKESLKEANKRQNKADHYRQCIQALHQRGIAVMAGFIAGFDGDTATSIEDMAHQLDEIGVDVPFLSVLTPFRGTPLYDKLEAERRMIKNRGWEFYNGYNVTFQPQAMSADRLLQAHRTLWRTAFSFKYSFKRIWRSVTRLQMGAIFLSLFMNGFYCLKNLRHNEPVDMQRQLTLQTITSIRPQTTVAALTPGLGD